MFANNNEKQKGARQLRGDDSTCPHCRADLGTYGLYDEFDGDSFSQSWECEDCGASGVFVYRYKLASAFYKEPAAKKEGE